jgi:predicted Zn-dependent protease
MVQGRQPEARQAMAAAMGVDPAVASQRYDNAAFLGGTGQSQRALVEFSSVVLLDPNLIGAQYGVGVEAARLGQTARAIQAFDAYLARDGASEWAERARQALARLRGQGPGVLEDASGGPGTCAPGTLLVNGTCITIQPRP